MAGFNIQVGDGGVEPADPNSILPGEKVNNVAKNADKARLILEKRMRDFEKAVEKIQLRVKSQVLTAGAMAQQRARSAQTPERLNDVISGLMGKQQNRIEGLEVDLLKSFDSIRTWIKTSGGTEDDIDHVQALFDEGYKASLENAPSKVREIMDALKEVSLKEMEARNKKKKLNKDEIEAKRQARRDAFADRKFQKQRVEQMGESAEVEAQLAKQAFLSANADKLRSSPFEFAGDLVDKLLLSGKRGSVSGNGPKARRQKILDEAQDIYDKTLREKSFDTSNVPSPEEVAAGKRSLDRGQQPIAPIHPSDIAKMAKGKKSLGSTSLFSGREILERLTPTVTAALVADHVVSAMISKAGQNTRDLVSGDVGKMSGVAFGAGIPGQYLNKTLTEITNTLDAIAKNTEQKTMAFSPDLIAATINKQLMMLDANMRRGEQLGSTLATISNLRTKVELSAQNLADKLLEVFGPILMMMLMRLNLLIEGMTSFLDIFNGTIKQMGNGNMNIFSHKFWFDVFVDAMIEAAKRAPTGKHKILGDVEAFLGNKPSGPGGVNTNIPNAKQGLPRK